MSRGFVECAQLAHQLRGQRCPVCDHPFDCGEDVQRREPFFTENHWLCLECSWRGTRDGRNRLARRQLQVLVREEPRLSAEDERLLGTAAIAVEAGMQLEEHEYERLFALYRRYGGDDEF